MQVQKNFEFTCFLQSLSHAFGVPAPFHKGALFGKSDFFDRLKAPADAGAFNISVI